MQIITSKDNEIIKNIRKLKEKKYRDANNEYLIEGIKLIKEAVEEKAKIKELMVPYIVGCIVMFSAFTIWKIVVTIGNQSLDESADNSVRFNQPIYMAGIKHNCDMIK